LVYDQEVAGLMKTQKVQLRRSAGYI